MLVDEYSLVTMHPAVIKLGFGPFEVLHCKLKEYFFRRIVFNIKVRTVKGKFGFFFAILNKSHSNCAAVEVDCFMVVLHPDGDVIGQLVLGILIDFFLWRIGTRLSRQ